LEGEERNMDLERIFRESLGENELTPSGDFEKRLMRKVEGKEFVRFNPRRINIYYLSAVAVIGLIGVYFLLNRGSEDKANYKTATELSRQEVPVDVEIKADSNKSNLEKNFTSTETVSTPGIAIKQKEELKPTDKQVEQQGQVINNDYSPALKPAKENLGIRNEGEIPLKTKAAFTSSSISGCAPLKVDFTNKSEGAASYKWIFDDGTISESENLSKVFRKEGEHTVTLKAFGTGGSVSLASLSITVFQAPVADFRFSPEKPVIPEDEVRFENYSSNGVRYLWNFGDGTTSESFEPEHRYNRFAAYNVSLTVSSENGCSDTLVLTNAFAGSGTFMNFPNAFIPNPDGPSGGTYSATSDETAQIFHPVSSGVNDYELRIFSKIGVLVFQSNDINIGWDGYHKGQLCEPGVYVWKARGKYRNGEPFVKSGDVTLIRYQ
jgi:PKD repeat protein